MVYFAIEFIWPKLLKTEWTRWEVPWWPTIPKLVLLLPVPPRVGVRASPVRGIAAVKWHVSHPKEGRTLCWHLICNKAASWMGFAIVISAYSGVYRGGNIGFIFMLFFFFSLVMAAAILVQFSLFWSCGVALVSCVAEFFIIAVSGLFVGC